MKSDGRFGRLHLADLFAAVALLIACGFAFAAVRDLTFPPDFDFSRDITAARAFQAGRFGEDPMYAGEAWWYPPLIPTLVAIVAKVGAIPLELVYARGGPFFNLLTPLSFYWMARRLLPSWSALFALVALLFFVDPALASWRHAIYSPWLYPFNFVEALAFAAVAVLHRAIERPTYGRFLLLGVVLGVVGWAHPAPFEIVAFTTVLAAEGAWVAGGRRREEIGPWILRLSLGLGVATAIASIFVVSLVIRYRMHTVNAVPRSWLHISGREMVVQALHPTYALAVVGAVSLFSWRRADRPLPSRVTIGALVIACVLHVVYGSFANRAFGPASSLRLPVPHFHYHLYFTACVSLLAGAGLGELVTRLAVRTSWRTARIVTSVVLIVTIEIRATQRPSSFELANMRSAAVALSANTVAVSLYRFFESQERGVILADPELSLWLVAAGHAAVVVTDAFSNPYVSYEDRARESERLMQALSDGDQRAFCELGGRKVRYAVLRRDQAPLPWANVIHRAANAEPEAHQLRTPGSGHIHWIQRATVLDTRRACL